MPDSPRSPTGLGLAAGLVALLAGFGHFTRSDAAIGSPSAGEASVREECASRARTGVDHVVRVNPDGSFSPDYLEIRDGDEVIWILSEPTDSIVPVTWRAPFPDICTAYKPYDPTDPNEFTGPLSQAPSGVFTIGPSEEGLVEVREERDGAHEACKIQGEWIKVSPLYLCRSGTKYETMLETWQSPSITGVFIRLEWDDVHLGPGDYDWSALDREIGRAVENGKLYSVAFMAGRKGTPSWIFDPDVAGEDVVQPLHLQDTPSHAPPGECGAKMRLGSPADPKYRKHYFDLLRAVAEHIREKNAWYRALAYFKPSGANLFTPENRLPKNCNTSEGCLCNPEEWALNGGYTPSALYEFYHLQTQLIAEEFPDKDMSYMLIQAGFPRVNDMGEYLTDPPGPADLPGGTEQTENILEQGRLNHGIRFVVEHDGLKPIGVGAPNRWVLAEGELGQFTAFQTVNLGQVRTRHDLEAVFANAWNNTDAIFLEIYEELLWLSEAEGPVLDPTASGRTIAEWGEEFTTRRRDLGVAKNIGPPFPLRHAKHFCRTSGTIGAQHFYYVHGSKCASSETFGTISVLP